jgi:hypothetical protein
VCEQIPQPRAQTFESAGRMQDAESFRVNSPRCCGSTQDDRDVRIRNRESVPAHLKRSVKIRHEANTLSQLH